MRMVNFSHDSVTSLMTLIYLQSISHTKVVIFQNPLHIVFLFHSWYVLLGFVRNMKIFCLEDLFKVIEAGILFTETSDYFLEILWSPNIPCSQIWHLCVTYVEWFTVTFDWFPVIWCKSWRVPHVGQERLTLSGTHAFTLFGEFMISPIHYIYTLHITEFVSFRTMFTDYGLFAWISQTALSRTYFILCNHMNN